MFDITDITETTAPRSDQQNFEDYLAGPKTVTVSEVRRGSAEQPVEIHLQEFPGRPFKPSKTVRRILVVAWGPDASQYVGRRMTLYGDQSVKWAGQAVGGIRVSALSHIDKPLKLMLAESKGKRAAHSVTPIDTTDAVESDPNLITDEQMKKMLALLTKANIADRTERLKFVSELAGREITTSKELTKDEASKVIDALNVDEQPPPEEPN